jgi:hypothetical protein
MQPGRPVTVIVFSALATLLAVLLLAACADMFQQKIAYPGKNDSLDNIFREVEAVTKLPKPEQLYVAPYYSDREIRLSWNAVPGAAYYKIECAALSGSNLSWKPEDEDYEIINDYCFGTFFIHEILKNPALDSSEYGNRYFYRVSAYNTVAKVEESDPTEPQSAMLFRSPTGLTASGGVSVDYIDVRWDRTAGADWYEIWKSESPSGAGARQMDRVRANQHWFQDKVSESEQGKDFYYMITAENSFGNKSLQTKPAYGYAKVFGAPNAPANVRLEDNSGRGHSISEIKIKWEPVDELDAYYAVYRYSSVDSSLTRLTEKTEDAFWSDSQGLKPGVYYYYKIQAIVDDIKSGKALKSEFSTNDPEGFVLSPPETVVAEKGQDATVTVKWQPAIGNENERAQYRYNVYGDNINDGPFSAIVMSDVLPGPDAEGYICAEGLPVTYTFFKVATIKSGITSSLSIAVSPAPAAAIIVDATQRAFIAGATANSSGVYPVVITWKKPEAESPAFYHIQRSTRAGTGFLRINEAALGANGPWSDVYFHNSETGIYTYIDRNDTARVARKYFYRVLSLNQLEQGRFPSDEKIGWGALTHTQFVIENHKTIDSGQSRLTYMHKSGSTDKLGTETKNGGVSGTVYYNAALQGLGARIIIKITDYCDYYIESDPAKGPYLIQNGNTNTTANMSANGNMDGTVNVTGMYHGWVKYDGVEVKGGAAGGGYYDVHMDGFPAPDPVRLPYSVLNGVKWTSPRP